MSYRPQSEQEIYNEALTEAKGKLFKIGPAPNLAHLPPARALECAAADRQVIPCAPAGHAACKRLCELLDATIEFASDEATGTTFRILLPRQYQQ